MKKTILFPLLVILIFCFAESFAESGWGVEYGFWRQAQQVDYRSLGLSKKTTLPVYAAPGEDAYRGANGKASVSLSAPFWILGETSDRTWQMIEYDVSKGARRTGWIHLPKSAAKPELSEIRVSAVLGQMIRNENLTDDPRGSGRVLTSLDAGQKVAVLFETRGDGDPLLYIKTEIQGQKAAGFVSPDACQPLPMYAIEGDTIAITDGVEQLGSASGWWDYGEDGLGTPVFRGEAQDEVFGRICLFLSSDEGGDPESDTWPLMETSKVRLPESIRWLGSEALSGIRAEEVRIPEGVACLTEPDTFYACSVGVLHIPSSLTDLNVNMAFTYTPIERFETAQEHPVYSARDGVLFSRDGKTLIAYPSGAKAAHYDVPAGTEVIAANAFRSDDGALPLVTISLPAGLREIGEYAFAECGEMISLAVPPTVRRVAENAFAYCVSLQRLSLPAGFTAAFEDEDWVIRDDFTHFNGDNGPTLAAPRENAGDWVE